MRAFPRFLCALLLVAAALGFAHRTKSSLAVFPPNEGGPEAGERKPTGRVGMFEGEKLQFEGRNWVYHCPKKLSEPCFWKDAGEMTDDDHQRAAKLMVRRPRAAVLLCVLPPHPPAQEERRALHESMFDIFF